MLRFKNTLTKKIEEFEPLERGKVRIYVCGLTVYDKVHLGHARSLVAFDVIVRYLSTKWEVIYVRNFTDIDDKIIERANREGIPWYEVAQKYIDEFYKDTEPLELVKPTVEPKATDHIQDMIKLIEKILEKGAGYVVEGDVFFSVKTFPPYGKLSGKKIDELVAGARVEVSEKKKFPLDFALWKASKPGEPFWDSPWGKGRPGWHIECSTMSMKYLGETFDIHGGGQDLIFPHHENEIAQSETATGAEFVRYWIHTGYLNIKGEKMSKSLGNVINLADLWREWDPELVRFFLVRHHYSKPINFTDELLKADLKTLSNFYTTCEVEIKKAGITQDDVKKASEKIDFEKKYAEFFSAMDDDFDTSRAIGFLFEKFSEIRKKKDKDEFVSFLAFLEKVHEILGVLGSVSVIKTPSFLERSLKLKAQKFGLTPADIDAMLKKREELRKLKKFEEADKIRQKLLEMGIGVQDTKFGPVAYPSD